VLCVEWYAAAISGECFAQGSAVVMLMVSIAHVVGVSQRDGTEARLHTHCVLSVERKLQTVVTGECLAVGQRCFQQHTYSETPQLLRRVTREMSSWHSCALLRFSQAIVLFLGIWESGPCADAHTSTRMLHAVTKTNSATEQLSHAMQLMQPCTHILFQISHTQLTSRARHAAYHALVLYTCTH
jgi:hypothetical protein